MNLLDDLLEVAKQNRKAKIASNLTQIVREVLTEAVRAESMFPPMNSPHEAEAVIREEFDEYWDEVKRHNMNKQRDTRPRQREELIQLAAMAVRAIYDTIDAPAKQTPTPNSQDVVERQRQDVLCACRYCRRQATE